MRIHFLLIARSGIYKLRIYFRIISTSLKIKKNKPQTIWNVDYTKLSKAEYICLVLFQKSPPTTLTVKKIDSKMSVKE